MSIREASGAAAERHLSREAMARLVSGAMGMDEMRLEALPHLLGRCERCRRVHDELVLLGRVFGHWNWTIALSEWDEAGRLWQGIAGLSYGEQLRAVGEDRELWTWGLCRLLQRMSLGDGGADGGGAAGAGDGDGWAEAEPVAAGRLANLALQVAARLSDAYDPVWVRGMRAVCLASLGNARRAGGEMEAASDAFAAARELVRAGVGSAAFEAEVMALEALLERDRWRLEEAIELCRRALAIYTGADVDAADARRAGRVLVDEAWCQHHLGRPARALERLEEAGRLLRGDWGPGRGRPRRRGAAPGNREPKVTAEPPGASTGLALAEVAELSQLEMAIRQGQVWAALALGNTEMAEAILAAGRAGASGAGSRAGRAVALRLRRAEARVAVATGRQEEGREILRQAAGEMLGMSEGVDAALALFDLAEVLVRAGAEAELGELEGELLRVLLTAERLEVDQRQAVVLFRQACEREREGAVGGNGAGQARRLTLAILRQLAGLVERSRRPSLGWWSGWATGLGGGASGG